MKSIAWYVCASTSPRIARRYSRLRPISSAQRATALCSSVSVISLPPRYPSCQHSESQRAALLIHHSNSSDPLSGDRREPMLLEEQVERLGDQLLLGHLPVGCQALELFERVLVHPGREGLLGAAARRDVG